MSARVLILTAGFGEGHNAAARNLAVAVDTLAGDGTAQIVDPFALASPLLNSLSRRGYISLINTAPHLWSAVYAWIDRSEILPRWLWFFRREARVIERIISEERPAIICSTYPIFAFILEKLRQEGRLSIPHFNLVTDSISINSLWWRPSCAGWFVPNADSADVLLRKGLRTEDIHPYGFPTPAFITANSHLAPSELAGLPQKDRNPAGVPRVLYIINSGTRSAESTARLLLAEHDWEITCTVGRDERLRRHLLQLAAGRPRPAQILGWTNEIPRLLLTHHLVVSKAGGATTQEAIAARCPMIVNQIVPGQEEGNYELLRRHGVGALAETPDAVISACRRAFAWNGVVWREWRDALNLIACPDAAQHIAAHLLASISAGEPGPRRTIAATPPAPVSSLDQSGS